MKLRDRSLAPPRNFFTPGARPATVSYTASAAAPRSQATSPMLPLSLCAPLARTPHASRSLRVWTYAYYSWGLMLVMAALSLPVILDLADCIANAITPFRGVVSRPPCPRGPRRGGALPPGKWPFARWHSEAYDYGSGPWARPSPKPHAYLSLGFALTALARANARMLINADSKRRSAKNRVRTSRQRSATPRADSAESPLGDSYYS